MVAMHELQEHGGGHAPLRLRRVVRGPDAHLTTLEALRSVLGRFDDGDSRCSGDAGCVGQVVVSGRASQPDPTGCCRVGYCPFHFWEHLAHEHQLDGGQAFVGFLATIGGCEAHLIAERDGSILIEAIQPPLPSD